MPSLIRLRLGFLFSAVLVGMLGIARDDERLVYGGMALGLIGLVLRFIRPGKPEGP